MKATFKYRKVAITFAKTFPRANCYSPQSPIPGKGVSIGGAATRRKFLIDPNSFLPSASTLSPVAPTFRHAATFRPVHAFQYVRTPHVPPKPCASARGNADENVENFLDITFRLVNRQAKRIPNSTVENILTRGVDSSRPTGCNMFAPTGNIPLRDHALLTTAGKLASFKVYGSEHAYQFRDGSAPPVSVAPLSLWHGQVCTAPGKRYFLPLNEMFPFIVQWN